MTDKKYYCTLCEGELTDVINPLLEEERKAVTEEIKKGLEEEFGMFKDDSLIGIEAIDTGEWQDFWEGISK